MSCPSYDCLTFKVSTKKSDPPKKLQNANKNEKGRKTVIRIKKHLEVFNSCICTYIYIISGGGTPPPIHPPSQFWGIWKILEIHIFVACTISKLNKFHRG